ncbi:MAG TPA: prepilin-type N-terminal cleavage/methylation domain-containing protein [bacterium]|nr:prepilin-type N-terminal cleavage/methylation domain-containing protein [bacterium]
MSFKAFTLLELMITISIVAILAVAAIPMYADYTKKARTIEVPEMLKEIAKAQFVFWEDPDGGRTDHYATRIGTLQWTTSLQTYNNGEAITQAVMATKSYENVDGKYWIFNAHNDLTFSCGSGVVSGVGIGSAIPRDVLMVPDDWTEGACMNTTKDLHHQ